MQISQIQPDVIVWGNAFPEKVRIIRFNQMGNSIKLTASGCENQRTYQLILNSDQIEQLQCTQTDDEYQGNRSLFKLGIESLRIALAYEYDPYFALSLARIDPLPHQLEAVYDYFLKMPRVRFLLADDPGAGKTVMAGLLLKELKVRGLVKRTLIITPANLSFQWQRELKEKFREQFEIMNSEILRTNYGINPWHDKNQVITSISWVSRIEDAQKSLLNSHWDLIIVDEAHKMSARSSDKKTLAYKLGEKLSEKTDHYAPNDRNSAQR
ncbi:MAG: DEAD/DEAH box helicase [Planctomycetaceae bacterium]|jgi:SNF2 family DNA or RNA helicase|nr:DEAD/DEAH box helicase [Planctomycetaceae bacterium]